MVLPDTSDKQIFALQIKEIVRITPVAAAVNFFNVAVICAVFWAHELRSLVIVWSSLLLLMQASALINWYQTLGAATPRFASRRGISRVTRYAALLSLLWGIMPIMLFNYASVEQQLFLVAIITGMICAGGFAMLTVRRAGIVYALILGGCGVIAILRSSLSIAVPLVIMEVLYVLTVIICVINSAKTFRARIVAELAAEQQSQDIGLLLHDFDQYSSDILWQVDESLCLQSGYVKLAPALGVEENILKGCSMSEVLRGHQQNFPVALSAQALISARCLDEAFKRSEPFRNIEVPLMVDSRVIWWSITAKPIEGGWRGVVADVTMQHEGQQRIWDLAHKDSLTGLGNRRQFQRSLGDTFEHIDRKRGVTILMCVDIDNFKAVNDAFGHSAGDQLLVTVGRRIQRLCKASDIVARIGGDEFSVILRDITHLADAHVLIAKIHADLQVACVINGITVPVSVCVGVAMYPKDGSDADTVLKHADLALYAGKAEGRGVLSFYDAEMSVKSAQRIRIEYALREALATKQLDVVFQLQQQLNNKEIVCFEALARWTHPELGVVAPDNFIAVAEDCGLIVELGSWVMERSCQVAHGWSEDINISVNISSVQLMEPEFLATVADILARTEISAHRLELEITESVLIDNPRAVIDTLHSLKRLGVRIALDDFGTGYSSMSYLRSFPFDKLKIDRSFIQDISSQAEALAIVRGIITMAHALRMTVVAEGVEDIDVFDLLSENGCDIIQGYFLSKPEKADNISGIIENYRISA